MGSNFTHRVLRGDEAIEVIDSIIPKYQEAFAGEPWFEVSKCPAQGDEKSCSTPFSSVAVGSVCEVCELTPNEEAFTADEISNRFRDVLTGRPSLLYVEENEAGEIALASLIWSSTPQSLVADEYTTNPTMQTWILDRLNSHGIEQVAWLEEIFADKSVRPSGNLAKFTRIIDTAIEGLSVDLLAYRTINPRMIRAATRDLPTRATIFTPQTDVPDHRYYVEIRKEGDSNG